MNLIKTPNLVFKKIGCKYCKIIIFPILILSSIYLSSCEKDEYKPENNDEYYIKYIVESNTMYNLYRNVKIKSENNSFKNYTYKNSKWEITIGPVEKGFQASLTAKYDTSQNLARTYINTEIQVSKNNSPFVLKTRDYNTKVRMSSSTNYTIK